VEEDGQLKPGGILEFMVEAKKVFFKQYQELIRDENKKFILLEPELKYRVKFRNYTKAGLLRIPSFVEYIS